MKRDGSESAANNGEEALLRQVLEGDQEAWAEVEQCLGETMRSWLRGHPSKEAACCWESEEHYVSLAFERFRQAVTAGQLRACTSLPTVLRYLQACLHGVLLDSLRTKVRPKGITLQEPAPSEEQPGGDHPGDRQLWERMQRLFPDVRERRVAYLLFHCNLNPRDIFCVAPQQFRDVQEIGRVRRHILERILLHSDLML